MVRSEICYNLFKTKKIYATKMNSENRRQEVERVAESEIALNRRVFVAIIGREIEEKVEKYSIVLPLLLIENK